MKKMLVVTMCAALAVTFTACGNSSSESAADAEKEVDESEEIDEEEDTEESEEPEEAETEYITATYMGMTYSYPADSDLTESDDTVQIILGDTEAIIIILSVDMAGSEAYSDEDVDQVLETAVLSSIEAYDDYQNEVIEDLTIADYPAKEVSALISTSSTWMNFDCVAIYDLNEQYIYGIQYAAAENSEGKLSEYQTLLDSISLSEVPEDEASVDESVSSEYIAALNSAESYSESLHLSKQGIYDQLTSEYGGQFSEDAAQYAIDNMEADWYENALISAESYSDNLHLSKQGVYDQLTSEYGGQFTEDEAQYAIDNMVADWNANALESAKSYRDNMNMSSSAIHDQLTSEYGGKFTSEEADYAIEHLE